MKHLPKLFISIIISSVLFAPFAYAATTGTVTTTVTPQNISLTVSDGNVTYGTQSLSATRSTLAAEENEMQTVTNNGNVNEDFDIMGQNSAAWTLGATQDANQYFHKYCNDTDLDCSVAGTNYTALTTSYDDNALDTAVASSGTVDFQLQIGLPSSTSSYSEQSVDVFVRASAS